MKTEDAPSHNYTVRFIEPDGNWGVFDTPAGNPSEALSLAIHAGKHRAALQAGVWCDEQRLMWSFRLYPLEGGHLGFEETGRRSFK